MLHNNIRTVPFLRGNKCAPKLGFVTGRFRKVKLLIRMHFWYAPNFVHIEIKFYLFERQFDANTSRHGFINYAVFGPVLMRTSGQHPNTFGHAFKSVKVI